MAGALTSFPYSQRHSEYIYHAMNNRLRLIDGFGVNARNFSYHLTVQNSSSLLFDSRSRTRTEISQSGRGTDITRDPVSMIYPLIAYKLDEGYAPKIGDIVCYYRRREPSWRNPSRRYISHGDVVVHATNSEIEVIGGNVGNAVTKKFLHLSNGRLRDTHWDWFAVIQNLIQDSCVPSITVG